MNKEKAIGTILHLHAFLAQHQQGYSTWGKVEVIEIAIRVEEGGYVFATAQTNWQIVKTESIVYHKSENTLYQNIFNARKKIQVVLKTQQQFASQVKDEIPPILDDQAQLLGVSIRQANSEQKIIQAINNRYAANVFDGTSLCIGNTLEDAYVAAQLLEKTSKVFVEAKALGGAKAINKIEAWFMQQYYLLKYSKEAEKNV
jgi:ribulose-5-phosphate 4-epimerase/fuculose-1-phosphate aldolase